MSTFADLKKRNDAEPAERVGNVRILDDPMGAGNENRCERRLPNSLRVFLGRAKSPSKRHRHKDLQCAALDCSIHGLRLRASAGCKKNEVVRIRVAIDFPLAMFELKGRIRWIRNLGDLGDLVQMGVKLEEDTLDYDDWVSRFHKVFTAELNEEEKRWFANWQKGLFN